MPRTSHYFGRASSNRPTGLQSSLSSRLLGEAHNSSHTCLPCRISLKRSLRERSEALPLIVLRHPLRLVRHPH